MSNVIDFRESPVRQLGRRAAALGLVLREQGGGVYSLHDQSGIRAEFIGELAAVADIVDYYEIGKSAPSGDKSMPW